MLISLASSRKVKWQICRRRMEDTSTCIFTGTFWIGRQGGGTVFGAYEWFEFTSNIIGWLIVEGGKKVRFQVKSF